MSDYLFGIFKPLVIFVCVFLLDLRCQITSLESSTFGYLCICLFLRFFKPLVIYVFVFPLDLRCLITLWNLQTFGYFCMCISLRFTCLITSLESSTFGYLCICLSLRFTASDYLFGIFKPLVIYVFVFLLDLQRLITSLVSSNLWLFCLSS